jgi:hypothetical protein
MSTLRVMVRAVCLIVALHGIATLGLVVCLLASGELTPARMERLTAAWREPETAHTQPTAATMPSQPSAKHGKSAETIAQDAMEREILWRERERIATELEQKEQAIRAALVLVSQKRDAFDELKKQEAEKTRKLSQLSMQDGYKKQLEIVSNLSPKSAVEFLVNQQPADAARMMLDLDARQSRKIYEAAKSRNDKARMNEILTLLRESAPARAEELVRK